MENKTFILGFFIVLFISSFFIFFHLGNGSLASWDEAFYGSITKQMLYGNNWLIMQYNNDNFINKPPFYMWISALIAKICGLNEYSVRFFSAMCGIGTIIAVFLLGNKMFNIQVGFLSVFSLLSLQHFIQFARMGMLDIPVTFSIVLGMYFFWLGRENNNYFLWMGICFGLGFMIKSFIVLLGIITIFVYIIIYKETYLFKNKRIWQSIGIFCLIIIPWHLYQFWIFGKTFYKQYFDFILFQRISQTLEQHSGCFMYYWRTILHNSKTTCYYAPIAVVYLLFYSIVKKRRDIGLILIWCFITFFTLSFSKTKLEWYIMPIYPVLSIIVAISLNLLFRGNKILYFASLMILLSIGVSHISQRNMMYASDYQPELKYISQCIEQKTNPDEIVVVYNITDSPAIIFYCDREIKVIWTEEELKNMMENKGKICLIAKKIDINNLVESYRANILDIKKTDNYAACYIKKSNFIKKSD